MTYRTLTAVGSALALLLGCTEIPFVVDPYPPTPLVIGEETTPPQGCIEHRERGGDLC